MAINYTEKLSHKVRVLAYRPAVFWTAIFKFGRPSKKDGFWTVRYHGDAFWTAR